MVGLLWGMISMLATYKDGKMYRIIPVEIKKITCPCCGKEVEISEKDIKTERKRYYQEIKEK